LIASHLGAGILGLGRLAIQGQSLISHASGAPAGYALRYARLRSALRRDCKRQRHGGQHCMPIRVNLGCRLTGNFARVSLLASKVTNWMQFLPKKVTTWSRSWPTLKISGLGFER
jgi:hypothetical protein